MALSATTLADGLKDAPEYPADEAATINKLSTAWNAYWEGSGALPGPIVANTAPALGVTAFKAALVGISTAGNTSNDAAKLFLDACKGFWTAAIPLLSYVTPLPPAPGPYATPPPFMLNSAAEAAWVLALETAFDDNTINELSKDSSMNAIAAAIHSGQAGATFLDTTVPTPLVYIVA